MARYGICEKCQEGKKLDIHHKDGNHDNDAPENREALCRRCHLVAHGRADRGTGQRSEYLPLDWQPEPIPLAEKKRQYITYFPRA